MKETTLHEVQASSGEMLKAMREERKLSAQDVAAKLYLDAGIIDALEQNNFSALPASAYNRGYLRSYARLVGADADLIISMYNKIAPEPPDIIPEVKHPTQISSRDKPIRVVTWMICLLLALLLFSWLQSHYMMPETDLAADKSAAPATQSTSPAAASAQSRNPGLAVIDVDLLTDVAPGDIESESIESTAVSDLTLVPDAGEAGGALTGALTTGAEDARNAPETAGDATLQTATTGGTEVDNDSIEASSGGTDTLKLRITTDSWVEVIDRDGQQLYGNLARTGDQITLTGAAPFAVKLGFSQGVILEFNDEPFDPAPYSRAGVASFTLP